jgi:hypothetical protein
VPAHHKGDRRLHVRREAAGECRRLTSPLQRRQFCITPVLETREGAKRWATPSGASAERLANTLQNAALCNFAVAADQAQTVELGCQHDATASRSQWPWHGGTPPCQLTDDTGRRTMVSSGVGHPATGAKRPPAGRVTGTTALLATGKPARCAARRDPHPALQRSCCHLAKHSRCTSPAPVRGAAAPRTLTDTTAAGKTKAVMLGGLAHSAQRSSIKKQAAQHDRAVRQRHATASWCLAIAVLRIGH